MVGAFSVQDELGAERALFNEVYGDAHEYSLLFWQPYGWVLIVPRRMECLGGFTPASVAVVKCS